MKVLLVKPPYNCRYVPFMVPLGLGSLAAVLEEHCHDVTIMDISVKSWGDYRRLLAGEQHDVVGITCMAENYTQALKAARIAREVIPEAKIIIGGVHVSFIYKDCLRENPDIDFVVVGEGEATLVELVDAVANGSGVHAIRGVAYREGPTAAFTGHRSPLMDLDSLPFLSYSKILPPECLDRVDSIPIITSRGCPHACSFCSTSKFWRKLRRNSNDYILDLGAATK